MIARTLFACLLATASADLLEYNYYAELADTVMKVEATGYALSSVGQAVARTDSGFKYDPVGAAYEIALCETAASALEAMFAGLTSAASIAAAFGDCDPWTGYGEFITTPFKGLYDKNFWCTKA